MSESQQYARIFETFLVPNSLI